MPYIITFPSIYHALNFEKKFANTDLTFTLRPVPREISSSCGIAAQITTDKGRIMSIWEECIISKIETDGLYSIERIKNKNKNQITPIIEGQV
ncbi:DUF3343 domain-containing protein [Desulfitibacter alkalitolerans]|uniref:DUF3343 domain-containing protein n=1 Tax=Desulfitibacter alkalitolerans TaxID=264641 RepID=UPI0006872945|nr:DUF3343 domain-containing protein [Desulfitibacter alkalitolerans]